MKKCILVAGATGSQGGAVLRHLQGLGHELRALTRDPSSAKARALSDAGINVVAGDMRNSTSLTAAMKDVDSVFAVQDFYAPGVGSPAMNLMQGELAGGTFTGKNVSINGLRKDHNGPVTLGYRAEDAQIVESGGQITAPVYSMELLGEATMVTVKAGGELVAVKAPKEYRAEIGETVHAAIPADICHLFDATTGERLS